MSRQRRADIGSLLARHGINPRKSLGQHFLADPNLIAKMVETAEVVAGDRVVEVGAGTGALTSALVAAGAAVVAFEVDERLRPLLEEVMGPSDLDLRFVDVTAIDLAGELGPGPWKLVANLPYNVGTSLVLDVLLAVPSVESLTVMVQAEVADRLTASPGSRIYGVPSLVVAYTAEVRARFGVPPQVFVPAPRVDSAVVRLDRRQPPAGFDVALGLARTAFAQRRKMLRSSLRLDPAVFDRAEIEPTSRPEKLSAADFLRLAEEVARA